MSATMAIKLIERNAHVGFKLITKNDDNLEGIPKRKQEAIWQSTFSPVTEVSPVTFPPGRAKLAMSPLPTGSVLVVMTIGIEWEGQNQPEIELNDASD
jgi:hypothetical protein